MVRALFEAGDDSKKSEHRLYTEVIGLKEALKTHEEKFDKTTRGLVEKLKTFEEEAKKLKKDNYDLNKDNKALKVSAKEAELEVLSAGDEAFDREKA